MSIQREYSESSTADYQPRVAKMTRWPKEKKPKYETELKNAVILGDPQTFEKLLKQPGADLNDIETILMLVKKDEYLPLLKIFLAQPNINYKLYDDYDLNPLARAIECHALKTARELIITCPDLINDKTSMYPPLHVAVQQNNLEMVTLLLNNGADCTFKHDKIGLTPIQYLQKKQIGELEAETTEKIKKLLEDTITQADPQASDDDTSIPEPQTVTNSPQELFKATSIAQADSEASDDDTSIPEPQAVTNSLQELFKATPSAPTAPKTLKKKALSFMTKLLSSSSDDDAASYPTNENTPLLADADDIND